MSHLSIGQMATQAKCKVETVHYYEKTGLMPEPPRTAGGHRMYTLTHAKRLNFIRRSRELGFNISQVRELLIFIDEPDHYCSEVKAMAMSKRQEIQQKIDDLKSLQSALDEMVNQCRGAKYSVDDCSIIEALYHDD